MVVVYCMKGILAGKMQKPSMLYTSIEIGVEMNAEATWCK
jgi:hypothetical protein